MASQDTLCVWDALSGNPPASGYATLDFRNQIPVLDFDAAGTEGTVFVGIMPKHYSSGGVTIYLTWMASTATSGNVVWETSIERGNTDLDADSFATGNNATGAADGTSGIVTQTSIAHTQGAQMDSVAVGEMFRLRVQRLGANGSDTMTGDAELVLVEMRET